MALAQLTDTLSKKVGIPKHEARALIRKLPELIKDVLEKEGIITLSGIGTFYLRKTKDKKFHNFATRTMEITKSKTVVAFKMSKPFRNFFKDVELI